MQARLQTQHLHQVAADVPWNAADTILGSSYDVLGTRTSHRRPSAHGRRRRCTIRSPQRLSGGAPAIDRRAAKMWVRGCTDAPSSQVSKELVILHTRAHSTKTASAVRAVVLGGNPAPVSQIAMAETEWQARALGALLTSAALSSTAGRARPFPNAVVVGAPSRRQWRRWRRSYRPRGRCGRRRRPSSKRREGGCAWPQSASPDVPGTALASHGVTSAAASQREAPPSHAAYRLITACGGVLRRLEPGFVGEARHRAVSVGGKSADVGIASIGE